MLCCSGLLALAVTKAPSDSALYEAYNQLHTHSQRVLGAEIESPAVVVVGRQTDGKSALIEALMGFQFNHVGGGTKTRRPIALQMQYDPEFEEPACYLAKSDGEQRLSLRELQAHIERENARLEAAKAFEAEEIIVRIRYKYCPNLIIIDTPGLLAASSSEENDINGRKGTVDAIHDSGPSFMSGAGEEMIRHPTASTRSFGSSRLRLRLRMSHEDAEATINQLNDTSSIGDLKERYGKNLGVAAQRTDESSWDRSIDGTWGASQRKQAADVETLVLGKIRSREAIVLCVEECNNWQLAPARTVVARADSALQRTVIVSSKLDTKFAQFGRSFLSPLDSSSPDNDEMRVLILRCSWTGRQN